MAQVESQLLLQDTLPNSKDTLLFEETAVLDSINHAISDTLVQVRIIDDSLYDAVFPVMPDYQWISYKMKVGLEQNGEIQRPFQLFYVNKIDSIIYINLNISGIELARVVMTPEQLTYVNKLEYTYYQGDYTFLNRLLGIEIDFYMIQALFNMLDFKDFERNYLVLEQESELQMLAERRCHKSKELCIWHDVWFNNQYQLIKNSFSVPNTSRSMLLFYSDYKDVGTKSFFHKLEILIPHSTIKINGELNNIKFNTPGPTGIKIPNNFKLIELP